MKRLDIFKSILAKTEKGKKEKINTKVPYSQCLIFSLTCEWAQYPRVLHFARLKRLTLGLHFSLLCPFKSYKENKVLSIWLQEKGKKEKTKVPYSQCFIFFVTFFFKQQIFFKFNCKC